jgi:putative ABC transport system permease protein
MPTDSQAVIINKTMADKLGYKDPLGKMITNGWEHFTVIGIVEDFHFESMKHKVEPLCMALGRSNDIVSVKVNAADMKHTMAAITGVWKSFAPNQPIRYVFLDESFARMYADVERTGLIFTSFSVLAVIVACLGLFALAAFMAEQRSKEISIRKVLGASASGLFFLLTNNFLKLVLISLAIAVPLGWLLMQKWLQDYEYRITITWDVFVISGIVVLLIALATICYQAVKAAIANPIKSLRTD